MGSRWLWWCAAWFLFLELGLRLVARLALDDGETVHVAGRIYLANATNARDVMAFGWSALTWLLIGLVIIFLFYLPFVLVGNFVSGMRGDVFISVGISSVTFMLAVAIANIIEKFFLGGVTDYLAWVDLPNGVARIINLGDLVLSISLISMSIAYIGMVVSVARLSASKLHIPS